MSALALSFLSTCEGCFLENQPFQATPDGMLQVFLILLSAHVFGDFLLQSAGMAARKGEFRVLAAHASIHGALTYLFLQQWSAWELPLAVTLLHALVDWLKARGKDRSCAFAVDQIAHVLILLALAYICLAFGWSGPFEGFFGAWIVGIAGFTAAVLGIGHFVGKVVDELLLANRKLADILDGAGLKEGGKQIGRLERGLIFLLILAGEPSGIAVLVAAKSILRFEEAKQQPVAEYVLIGTLWSFGLSMVVGWLTQKAIEVGL